MTDVFSKQKRSEVMSKIRSRNTQIEKDFTEKHPNAIPHPDWLPYHPDFILDGKVIFLDSTFWHCRISKSQYDKLSEFWQKKLFTNLVRDLCANSFYGSLRQRDQAYARHRAFHSTINQKYSNKKQL